MRQLLLALVALVSARCFYSLKEVESNTLFTPAVATAFNLGSILTAMNTCCVDRAKIAGWNNFRGIYVVYSNGTVVPGEAINLPDTSVFFERSARCGVKVVFARRDCQPCRSNVIYPIGDPENTRPCIDNDIHTLDDAYCTDLQPTFPAESYPPAMDTCWDDQQYDNTPHYDVEHEEPRCDQYDREYQYDPQPDYSNLQLPTVSPDSQCNRPVNYRVNYITYSPILYSPQMPPITEDPSPPVETCPIEPESCPKLRQICRTSKEVKCGQGYRSRRIRTKSRSFTYSTVNNKNILTVDEINNKQTKTKIVLDRCTREKIRILNHPDTLRAIKEATEQALGAPADLYVSDTSGVYVLVNNTMYAMKSPESSPRPLAEKLVKKLMEKGLYSVDVRS